MNYLARAHMTFQSLLITQVANIIMMLPLRIPLAAAEICLCPKGFRTSFALRNLSLAISFSMFITLWIVYRYPHWNGWIKKDFWASFSLESAYVNMIMHVVPTFLFSQNFNFHYTNTCLFFSVTPRVPGKHNLLALTRIMHVFASLKNNSTVFFLSDP